MNDHDRQNLIFLLTADADTLSQWYDQMSEDDHEYAHELLAQYSLELKQHAIDLRIEAELMLMSTFEQAQCVIGKIKG